MRFEWLLAILALVISNVVPAQAELYKYRDAQGHVCYTDNLAEVPKDQRPHIQALEEVAATPSATTIEARAVVEDKPQAATDPSDEVVNEETITDLNSRKQELDKEFAGLMDEKYKLLREKHQLDGLAGRDVEARKAYEDKVTALNERIADYQIRRNAFQKKADQVKQSLNPQATE